MFGVAITTSSICVGSRCPWVRAGVGVVATQNVTLPSIGPMVLDRLEQGEHAQQALDQVLSGPVERDYRQVTVIDAGGRTAHFSGVNTLGTNAVSVGDNCVAAGNLLKSESLPEVMKQSFESNARMHLAPRLLTALEAGLVDAGGEMGPVHSAALLVADKTPWPLVDLRVDWDDENPITGLWSLWRAYEPEMADYVTRALDPSSAPSYGVPGDE